MLNRRKRTKTRKPDARSVRTRKRILDVAEQLFARQGFHGVSLRQITVAAGVNVAATHYHFRTKRHLFIEVFTRRNAPIQEARIERLKACAESNLYGEQLLDCFLHAFVEPFVEATLRPNGEMILLLVHQVSQEADGRFARSVLRSNDEIWDVGAPLLQRALPHLSREVVLWRFYFMLGAILHLCRPRAWLKERTGGLCDAHDLTVATAEIIDYLKGAMMAPAESSHAPMHRKSKRVKLERTLISS